MSQGGGSAHVICTAVVLAAGGVGILAHHPVLAVTGAGCATADCMLTGKDRIMVLTFGALGSVAESDMRCRRALAGERGSGATLHTSLLLDSCCWGGGGDCGLKASVSTISGLSPWPGFAAPRPRQGLWGSSCKVQGLATNTA